MAQTVGIVVEFVHRDAHESFVRLGIVRIEIVGVVGRDNLDAGFETQPDKLLVDAVLIADTVTHQLQIEIVAENLFIFQCHLFGTLVTLCPEFDIALG